MNIVHGYGPEVGQAIVEHPEIRAISFTGGTSTGKIVAVTAAPMFKKLSLELGGKNASLVLDDADLACSPLSFAGFFPQFWSNLLVRFTCFGSFSIYDEFREIPRGVEEF